MNEFQERLAKAIGTNNWINLVKRQDMALVKMIPYTYSASFSNIADTGVVGSAISSTDIVFDGGSDFVMLFSSAATSITATGAAAPLGAVYVQMTDQNTRQSLFSQFVYAPNVFGFGAYPYIWPVPVVFQAKTRLKFELDPVNNGGSAAYDYQFALTGVRLFYTG